jgi:diacylglycerol kinase (ATP)
MIIKKKMILAKKTGDRVYFFIINKQSGNGFKVWEKLLPLLTNMNVEYTTCFITKKDQLLHLKAEIQSLHIKAIVIVGGDGTVHHILPFIEETSIPIGIIPAGSGNDFARALKIPKKSSLALKKLLQGKIKEVDIIYVNGEPCTTVVGIGFDAKVTDITNRSNIKKWLNYLNIGKLAYVAGVLRSLFSFKPKEVVITVDGKKKNYPHLWLIAIANTPFYGGGLKICPNAEETDGILSICIADSLSKLEVLLLFPLIFLGKHTVHPGVTFITGRKIEISAKLPLLVQADGEVLGTNLSQ